MKKTFNFGKIAFNGKKKINSVEVDVEFENGIFSASGSIWNSTHTDIVYGGQCLDTIKNYINNEVFNKIWSLWKMYHLNDMHPGTFLQEKALKDKNIKDYDESVKYLKKISLYIDKLSNNESLKCETERANRNHYEYGCGWIKREIPSEDIKEIKKLFE